MKRHLLSFWAVLLLALPASAADHRQALERLNSRLDRSLFSSASLSAQNQLTLKATDGYAAMPAGERRKLVSWLLTGWRRAIGADAPVNLILSIAYKGGGELWLLSARGAARIDEWSGTRLPFTPDQMNRDRFFGYAGFQFVPAKDDESSGTSAFNARLGKTFLNGRYDAAVFYGYADFGEDSDSTSYGFTGRALFPINKRLGWNLGASLTRNSPSTGDASTGISGVGGINFYLPGGSFDITASMGNKGMYSLMAGYTVHLTRK